MKIAFVTFEYPPSRIGGAGVYAASITRELAKEGHDVVVFTTGTGNQSNAVEKIGNLTVLRIPLDIRSPLKTLRYWLHLPKMIRECEKGKKFDVIHVNGISYWFLNGRLSSAPHVLTIHHTVRGAIAHTGVRFGLRLRDVGGESGFLIPAIERLSVRIADRLMAVSSYTKNDLVTRYGLDPEEIDVVMNGIDVDRYDFDEKALEETRRLLGLEAKPIILNVGRIDDPRKGTDTLLEAMAIVLERVDAVLLLVGSGNPVDILRISKSLGISKNVHLLGFVDDALLRRCYALSDLYVCSSRLEGFGLSIAEAMAAGKAVVATNVGGIPEIVEHERTGFLVAKDDPQGMAERILFILTNKHKKAELSKNGKEKASKMFDWSISAKLAVDTYNTAKRQISDQKEEPRNHRRR